MKTPKQFNNITTRVVDDLHSSIQAGSKISIAAASFSIYAYEALKNESSSPLPPSTPRRRRKRNESSTSRNSTENVIFSAQITKSASATNSHKKQSRVSAQTGFDTKSNSRATYLQVQ